MTILETVLYGVISSLIATWLYRQFDKRTQK